MKWTRDGDQHVARGTLGEYRITEWCNAGGGGFFVTVSSLREGRRRSGYAECGSLAKAKEAAENHEGKRATA